MLRAVLVLVMLALVVVLPAIGCRKARPTPTFYPPIGITPTPTSGVAPAVADEWVCPMHPTFKMSQPGKCSICGMDLVHASESSGAQGSSSASGHSHSEGSHSKGSGHSCCG